MTYDDILPLMEARFPEWWNGFLSEFALPDSGGAHCGCGDLVALVDEAMRLGARAYAARIAAFADTLAASADPRVENVLYVSVLENLDNLRPADLRLVAGHLGPRARGMLSEMVPAVDGPIGSTGE
jgi:hypothetical protein